MHSFALHCNELSILHSCRSRLCFFTSDSTMKKDRFMQLINHSFIEGGLTCSFNDYQLSEFIQQKLRKAGKLPVKKAVNAVGQQDDGTWVLGPNLYMNGQGELVDPDLLKYMWVGHLYEGPNIAPQCTACPVELPLTITPLTHLLQHLRVTMKHNFIPAVLLLGSCAMAMHYHTILDKFMFCPVPIAYGRSGTGKTTALRCGLAICGSHPARFYSKASLEKYNDLCCDSHLPLGIDDPRSRAAISDLTMALFNGAKGGTLRRGDIMPKCMAVISANFTTKEQEQ